MKKGEHFLLDNAAFLLLAAGCIVFGIFARGFFTVRNISNLLSQMSIYALLTAGLVYPVILRGMDLSVAASGALAGVLAAYAGLWIDLRMERVPVLLAVAMLIFVAAVTGIVTGYVNGWLTASVGIPPVMCTLAMAYTIRGLTYAVAGSQPVYVLEDHFAFLGTAKLIRFGNMSTGLIPVSMILTLIVIISAHLHLTRTASGKQILAVGRSESAAAAAGINVTKTVITGYVLCSLLAALAGVISASRFQNGHPGAMEGYEMYAIAAVLLGGCSLSGGRGSQVRALAGTAAVSVLKNGMDLTQMPSYWQKAVTGVVILLAIIVDIKKRDE